MSTLIIKTLLPRSLFFNVDLSICSSLIKENDNPFGLHFEGGREEKCKDAQVSLELPNEIDQYPIMLKNISKTIIKQYKELAIDWLEELANKAEKDGNDDLMFEIEKARMEFEDEMDKLMLC